MARKSIQSKPRPPATKGIQTGKTQLTSMVSKTSRRNGSMRTQLSLATSVLSSMRSTRMESLRDQTLVWWDKKSKKQRQRTSMQLCAIITMISIVFLSLIMIGVLSIYATRHLRRALQKGRVIEADLGNLTTKTHICRSHFINGRQMECVYEDLEHYRECRIKDDAFCVDNKWRATFVGHILSFTQHRTKRTIATTDYSDCGVGKWCQGQHCLQKPGGWWKTYSDPLPREDDPEPLAKVTPKENIETYLPCLEFAPGSKEPVVQLISYYTQGCNRSLCGNLHTDYAFRIQWYHCNLSNPDPVTGMRQRACTTLFKVLACHLCKPSDRWSDQSIHNPCDGPFVSTGLGDCMYRCRRNATKLFPQPDGTRCKPDEPSKICVAGNCYDMHQE